MIQAPKAKSTSLAGQIVASIWIAGWTAYKFISTGLLNVTVYDIMMSGVGIAMCFTPVYFSILMDKVKEIRFGPDTAVIMPTVPEQVVNNKEDIV